MRMFSILRSSSLLDVHRLLFFSVDLFFGDVFYVPQ